jgi:hypothetical protein
MFKLAIIKLESKLDCKMHGFMIIYNMKAGDSWHSLKIIRADEKNT